MASPALWGVQHYWESSPLPRAADLSGAVPPPAVPRANPAVRYTNYIVAIYVFRGGKAARARIYEDTAYVQAFEHGDPNVMSEIKTAMES
jgi:hypothetical protein